MIDNLEDAIAHEKKARTTQMNNTERCLRIFHDLIDARELAREIGNKEIFELFEQTCNRLSEILDKELEKKSK